MLQNTYSLIWKRNVDQLAKTTRLQNGQVDDVRSENKEKKKSKREMNEETAFKETLTGW